MLVIVSVLFFLGIACAQDERYPIMERLAQKVVQQIAMQKAHPPTGRKAAMEARVIEMLRSDPQMRQEFINRVAAPIANRLFECGMIP
jgi:hypothetical protein